MKSSRLIPLSFFFLAMIMMAPGLILINYAQTTLLTESSAYGNDCYMDFSHATALGPAYLSGMVFNAATGSPIIGATITVGTSSALSTGPDGAYTVTVYQTGNFGAACIKTGFDYLTAGPFNFTPNSIVGQNFALPENANAPDNVTAALNTDQTAVNISWGSPKGYYELLYDDGIQEGFNIWPASGSYNAVLFTPVGYPCVLNGCKINIGTQDNYPQGGNPLVPFEILIFDASGSNGAPGIQIGGPYIFTPAGYGWNDFSFAAPFTINSGNFYLVMKQGGAPPNAAGIAVDNTTPPSGSYSRNMPGGSWVTGSGSFMMRAFMYGSGGPIPLMGNKGGAIQTENLDNTEGITGYEAWRLLQGQENTPALWTSIGTATSMNIPDNAWPALPCNQYRWAVKAKYPGNRWSNAAFSNVIPKCMTAAVTVKVNLSCTQHNTAFTHVKLQNSVYADTVYQATMSVRGTITFPSVWKGNYTLTVEKFGYMPDTLPFIQVTGNMTLTRTLIQQITAPSNLQINDLTLVAAWSPPLYSVPILTETWASGSLVTNGWATSGGTNWQISTTFGKPAPSVTFNSAPHATNYHQYLTSADLTGLHSPALKLNYGIYLSNNSAANMNTMAVELWDGTSWHVLKSYTNLTGNIPWESESIDISAYTHTVFKIRFHASGNDSYGINYWAIDNISVVACEAYSGSNPCVTGYNFYLDNILAGSSPDTTYTIPSTQVVYGQSYSACVNASYSSGTSTQACNTFTSHFLSPPTQLHGDSIDDCVLLTWEPPQGHWTSSGLLHYNIYRSLNGPGGPWLIDRYTPHLFYIDCSLELGTYCYMVAAEYDLTTYGFPGQTGESFLEGPVCVNINYGEPIPFCERWDGGSFSNNHWIFDMQGPGNWIMNTAAGYAPPCADFRWDSFQTNYTFRLQSNDINAGSFTSEPVWLDFDYKLIDRNLTSNEKLTVELYYNETWHQIDEFVNNGDVDWTAKHYNISAIHGKAFRVGFRANGANSADILHWYIDNICITGIPTNARLANITIPSGAATCYNALQTITVAGNGATYSVISGGDATLIAGQKILFLPGTRVEPGGHLWGYIAESGNYCYNSSPPVQAPINAEATPAVTETETNLFSVYPNPTTGKFTLEIQNQAKDVQGNMSIYGLLGNEVLQADLAGKIKSEFSLTGRSNGIYIVRVTLGDRVSMAKMIKQ